MFVNVKDLLNRLVSQNEGGAFTLLVKLPWNGLVVGLRSLIGLICSCYIIIISSHCLYRSPKCLFFDTVTAADAADDSTNNKYTNSQLIPYSH